MSLRTLKIKHDFTKNGDVYHKMSIVPKDFLKFNTSSYSLVTSQVDH